VKAFTVNHPNLEVYQCKSSFSFLLSKHKKNSEKIEETSCLDVSFKN